MPDDEYADLVARAYSLGAAQARLVPTSALVVERRVTLKCRFGCPDYGRSHSCPPRVPSVDEFRGVLAEYGAALVVAFPSRAGLRGGGASGRQRNRHGEDAEPAAKRQVEEFYREWEASKGVAFAALLELEKEAFNRGEPLALALRPGRCTICAECDVGQPCRHATRLRFSPEAVGVNLAATCRRAGMDIVFPFTANPSHVGILLLG